MMASSSSVFPPPSSSSVIRTCGILMCFALLLVSSSLVDPDVLSNNSLSSFSTEEEGNHYTDQWAVYIVGGEEVANAIAKKHGFVNTGKILSDHYHFIHPRLAKRSLSPHQEFHALLSSEPEVKWHQQQRLRRRSKRDFLQLSPKPNGRRTVKRSRVVALNDPRWPAMWYLNRGPGLDMNVNEAWNEGVTGKGIVVTILDDGLEKDHPDIVRNYDPLASYDVNSLDNDPMPTYDLTDSNRHGTRCAGEVAAEANNSICAVGVAFEASVGGVRMLDGDVTDAVEARSLSHEPQHVDIYSASWGPDDDGKTVDGPGELATRAFMEGVAKGRAGKGSIFVWASGNGGRDHDNCNCDGYTNSIWTLSISSATENGLVPWYSEACSSTLATTYSSGGTGEKQIVTIDLHHSCTSSHTGTSASAPLAAGICALALQANTNLTWRDMQHIVVRTARPQNLIAPDWATNGVGRNVSHSFGYGLMDAGAMVKLAKAWKAVPEQYKCEIRAPYSDKNIPAKSKVTLDLKVTNCSGVNFLEHVQAKVTLTSGRRGDLQIYLVSPAGTRSTLLAHRRHDLNRAGFTDWPFMTVHSWGENPIGKWTLEIHNEGRYAGRTVLKRWSLIAYGTDEDENSQMKSQVNTNPPIVAGAPILPVRYPAKIDLSYLKNKSIGFYKSPIDSTQVGAVGSSVGNSSLPQSSKSTIISDSDLVVTTIVKKPRQRIKGKLVSKKQKGISPPPGPASQRPSTRLVTENPEHLTRSNSNEDETKLFLSAKFGNQSQVNETTMRIPLKAKENSLNSSSSSSLPLLLFHPPMSSSFGGEDADATVGVNSSIATTTTTAADATGAAAAAATTSAIKFNPRGELAVKVDGDGGSSLLVGESPSKNSTANQNQVSRSSLGQDPATSDDAKGKLQTWTLVAHGIASSPNDPEPAVAETGNPAKVTTTVNTSGLVAMGKVPVSGEGTGNESPFASIPKTDGQSAVDFDGSENSIVIQPSQSHVQNPPLGIDAAQATIPVATSSSSSSCAKVSTNGQCLDCLPNFALFHGTCVETCPETFYRESRGPMKSFPAGESSSSLSHICLPCHYSCRTCDGPNDYQCLSCHGDSNLVVKFSLGEEGNKGAFNQSHCYPAVLLDTLDTNNFWYKTLLVIVIINVALVAVLLIYIFFQRRSPGEAGKAQRQSYRRLSPEEEYRTSVLDVDQELMDSEEEEEEHFSQDIPSSQRLNNYSREFRQSSLVSLPKTNATNFDEIDPVLNSKPVHSTVLSPF